MQQCPQYDAERKAGTAEISFLKNPALSAVSVDTRAINGYNNYS